MPEGPEAKIVADFLNKKLKNKTIKKINCISAPYKKRFGHVEKELKNFLPFKYKKNKSIGKHTFIELNSNFFFSYHLGMTGYWDTEKNKHCHLKIETDKKFICYHFNKKYYKVPTFGRLFKIIDFGRAIYKFKDKIICSDSFLKKGDAATQYNFGPCFNKKKPRLEPNFSFDLSRLACSLYDYFVPYSDEERKVKHPIGKLVIKWCRDDNGKNILYKKNGDERYPDFKLYKMIARTVHNHIPAKEIENEIFNDFIVTRKSLKKKRIINVENFTKCYS